MYTKAKIFNLALGALLLQRQIVEPETEKSNEAKVLLTHYDAAFRSVISDLDLDSTSLQAELELYEEEPNDLWGYAYKYPTNCARLRRVQSVATMDNRSTHIPRKVGLHIMSGVSKKAIFTNEEDAIIEYIPYDIPLSVLSAQAGLAIAYRLAILAAPLITGKGALKLIEAIEKKYIIAKAEAQAHDQMENFNFVDEDIDSEFVEARLE